MYKRILPCVKLHITIQNNTPRYKTKYLGTKHFPWYKKYSPRYNTRYSNSKLYTMVCDTPNLGFSDDENRKISGFEMVPAVNADLPPLSLSM
jgi:hypothetical protein